MTAENLPLPDAYFGIGRGAGPSTATYGQPAVAETATFVTSESQHICNQELEPNGGFRAGHLATIMFGSFAECRLQPTCFEADRQTPAPIGTFDTSVLSVGSWREARIGRLNLSGRRSRNLTERYGKNV
jgi:hypothetical protein